MYIGPTKLLEDNAPNYKFDKDRRFCIGFTGLNWDDSAKIEETITINKDNKNEIEDSWEKNRQLKREKQC